MTTPVFPTDPVTLAALRSACIAEDSDDGRSHLFDFLDFGAEIEERTVLDPGADGSAPVMEVTYKPGRAPWSPQAVIVALCDKIEQLRTEGAE